jgi:hypothetical protein
MSSQAIKFEFMASCDPANVSGVSTYEVSGLKATATMESFEIALKISDLINRAYQLGRDDRSWDLEQRFSSICRE